MLHDRLFNNAARKAAHALSLLEAESFFSPDRTGVSPAFQTTNELLGLLLHYDGQGAATSSAPLTIGHTQELTHARFSLFFTATRAERFRPDTSANLQLGFYEENRRLLCFPRGNQSAREVGYLENGGRALPTAFVCQMPIALDDERAYPTPEQAIMFMKDDHFVMAVCETSDMSSVSRLSVYRPERRMTRWQPPAQRY